MNQSFLISVADEQHEKFAEIICAEMETSAKARGTGIAKRSPDYVREKMREGKAVVALTSDGEWAGFCYIESWSHGKYVANSGLIVSSQYRRRLAVMKINSELGYEPVTYSELTDDADFWKGCQSCVNFEILQSKDRKNCLCTAMLYNPEEKENVKTNVEVAEAKKDAESPKFFHGLKRIFSSALSLLF